jgi:hypothetical protein
MAGGGVVAALLMTHLAAGAAVAPARAKTRKAGSGVPATAIARAAEDTSAAAPEKPETPETLKGGEDGTVFRSLTVQGDDRIHLEVERPDLDLEMDPQKAPGLELGDAGDVLARSVPDAVAPLTALSAHAPSPWVAQPWLDRFASGAVARFRPEVEGVERWQLLIADSRGAEVARFSGSGKPPREIAWDGRGKDGAMVAPGRTYSHVLEAWDKAGNKRHFVGRGFSVTTYRLDGPNGPTLLFTGHELDAPASGAPGAPSALLVEAATWLHQAPDPTRPLRVTATARGADRAGALADRVARSLGALMMGDPARVRPVAQVQPDAPDDGVVQIEFMK